MKKHRADLVAIFILIALWLLFFWRLFTPIPGDQAAIKQGDFSGQFVAFAGYQYSRFSQGEVPLWNPYNNGGLPFIADTQAAVFYPPRLLTIAASNLAGGWSYHALELEMTFHVLLYSLLMYILLRRMTLGQSGSTPGSLVGAIIASYGGFMSGYPQLQLAILEAGIWLPLAVLGILEATRQTRINWPGLVLTGFALGLSWMAGHPQTSWFLTYLLVAYLAYRTYIRRYRWSVFIIGTLIIGLFTVGIAAVQLFPGFEYLAHTARLDLTYDAKANGFPFKDVLQFLFPGQLSVFSPLYFSVVGLALVLVMIWYWHKVGNSLFWGGASIIALSLSFGDNSAVFPTLYNLLPGLRFFRGQERAAYLVANSLAILAGLSAVHIMTNNAHPADSRKIRRTLLLLILACTAGIFMAHTDWLSERPDQRLSIAIFSTVMAITSLVIIWRLIQSAPARLVSWALVGLLVFELFTVNMTADSNFDPVPPTEQLAIAPPSLIAQALADTDIPFRVDGFRGLLDNFGSLYSLADMRGISPLFLAGPFALIEPDKINPLAWELFAVRYVYSDWQELPWDSQIIGSGNDRYGIVNLHQLTDPRPFAHIVYDAVVLDSDAFAFELLRDPNFNPRTTVILEQAPAFELDVAPEAPGSATVTAFAPETMVINVETPANAILSLAHPDYPGWYATLDGNPVVILRAYGALTAIPVPAGTHEIVLQYDPLIYRIGALLSLVSWLGVSILGVIWFVRQYRASIS